MATCKDCLPCGVQFNCKKKLPCGLQGGSTNAYPYFPSSYPTPPSGLASFGSISGTTVSEEYSLGDDVVFESVVVNPEIVGTVNAVGYISSPLTGGVWYQVEVADDGAGGIDLTIPYSVFVTLYNQGIFLVTDTVSVKAPYYLNLKVFQTV